MYIYIEREGETYYKELVRTITEAEPSEDPRVVGKLETQGR